MGVLDDAIRQHLELKRKRGADPTEVKREEDEALGEPVRPKRAVATEVQEEAVHQPTQAFDPAEVAQALGQMPPDEVGEQVAEPEAELEAAPEADAEPEPEAPAEPVAEPQHEADPEPDPPEPDEGPVPSTEEPVAEDEAAPDELEQTPDFLEDAPEHDKLWFEQKPPKDFDF